MSLRGLACRVIIATLVVVGGAVPVVHAARQDRVAAAALAALDARATVDRSLDVVALVALDHAAWERERDALAAVSAFAAAAESALTTAPAGSGWLVRLGQPSPVSAGAAPPATLRGLTSLLREPPSPAAMDAVRLSSELSVLSELSRAGQLRPEPELAARFGEASALLEGWRLSMWAVADAVTSRVGGDPSALAEVWLAASPKRQEAVLTALAQVGDRYVFGAQGPDRFDCSGLTTFAWRAAGVSLSAYSYAQQSETRPVKSTAVRPGDLVFWDRGFDEETQRLNGHVAMLLGMEGVIVEAHGSGLVRVSRVTGAFLSGYGAVRVD